MYFLRMCLIIFVWFVAATKRDDFGRLVLGDIVVAVNGQVCSNLSLLWELV
jgi:hypothetical protein